MKQLSHLDQSGRAAMVDVSAKPVVARVAVAAGKIYLAPETLNLISKNRVAKGDVLNTARIAGIQAAKRCGELIPLCHPLPLTHISVEFTVGAQGLRRIPSRQKGARRAPLRSDRIEIPGIEITAMARTAAQTGVEMEALTAVSVAALTIYDMCKAVDKTMRIGDIRLLKKTKAATP